MKDLTIDWKIKAFLFLLFIISASIIGWLLVKPKEENKCAPPDGFRESDLIGTWQAGLPENTDTIIFREDGYYQQIIHQDTPRFDYIGGWKPWRIQAAGDGTVYLHLEEMRLCVYWPHVSCEQMGGGEQNWYDYCQDEWVKTPLEGVLIIRAGKEGFNQPPRGFYLSPLQIYTIGGIVYTFLRP